MSCRLCRSLCARNEVMLCVSLRGRAQCAELPYLISPFFCTAMSTADVSEEKEEAIRDVHRPRQGQILHVNRVVFQHLMQLIGAFGPDGQVGWLAVARSLLSRRWRLRSIKPGDPNAGQLQPPGTPHCVTESGPAAADGAGHAVDGPGIAI